MSINDFFREHELSQPTFYSCKMKCSGMDASHGKLLNELKAENSRLKRMFADVSLQRDALKDLIVKKFYRLLRKRIRLVFNSSTSSDYSI